MKVYYSIVSKWAESSEKQKTHLKQIHPFGSYCNISPKQIFFFFPTFVFFPVGLFFGLWIFFFVLLLTFVFLHLCENVLFFLFFFSTQL